MSVPDASWIGYPKDYWDKDGDEYFDDCLVEEECDEELYG